METMSKENSLIRMRGVRPKMTGSKGTQIELFRDRSVESTPTENITGIKSMKSGSTTPFRDQAGHIDTEPCNRCTGFPLPNLSIANTETIEDIKVDDIDSIPQSNHDSIYPTPVDFQHKHDEEHTKPDSLHKHDGEHTKPDSLHKHDGEHTKPDSLHKHDGEHTKPDSPHKETKIDRNYPSPVEIITGTYQEHWGFTLVACVQFFIRFLIGLYIFTQLIYMPIAILDPNRPLLLDQILYKHFEALDRTRNRMKPLSLVYVIKESDVNVSDFFIKTNPQKCIGGNLGDVELDPTYHTVPVHALLVVNILNDDNQHGIDALVISDHELFPLFYNQQHNNVDVQGAEGSVQQPLHDVVEVQGPEGLLQQPQENNSAALVVSNTDPPCLIHNNQPQQPEHLVVENEEAEGPIQQPQDNNATMLVISEHESSPLIYNQLQQHVVGVHRDLIQQPDQNNDVMLDDVNDGLPPLMFNQPEADGPVEQPEHNNVMMAVADHGQMADQPNGNDPAAMERWHACQILVASIVFLLSCWIISFLI